MKKLRLELDALHVESFGTDGTGDAAGTVVAHHDTSHDPFTVPTHETTNDRSRVESCYYDTCYWTCGV